MNKTLFIDTETTGLSRCGGDALVEVSVVDDDGNVLLSTLSIRDGKFRQPPATSTASPTRWSRDLHRPKT
jgi:hypothetical protein